MLRFYKLLYFIGIGDFCYLQDFITKLYKSFSIVKLSRKTQNVAELPADMVTYTSKCLSVRQSY